MAAFNFLNLLETAIMIEPKYLTKGDLIGIVSPASFVDETRIRKGIDAIKQAGFEVKIGAYTFSKHHQFAASDENRAADLQKMLDDNEIKAIIFARGGYGSMRTNALLNWNQFNKNPKWLVGFSDITVFHNVLQHQNICSVHSPMPGNYILKDATSQSFQKLIDCLKGKQLRYELKSSIENKTGVAEGKIVGGNLSILYSLRGTPFDINWDNRIVFIEDLDEPLYHIDRIITNLKVGKKLDKLKGIIVGSFTDMRDRKPGFGMNYREIILDAVKDFDYPVVFDFPAGHISENFPIIFGKEAKLTSTTDRSTIQI